jgi:putative copper export protein
MLMKKIPTFCAIINSIRWIDGFVLSCANKLLPDKWKRNFVLTSPLIEWCLFFATLLFMLNIISNNSWNTSYGTILLFEMILVMIIPLIDVLFLRILIKNSGWKHNILPLLMGLNILLIPTLIIQFITVQRITAGHSVAFGGQILGFIFYIGAGIWLLCLLAYLFWLDYHYQKTSQSN